MIKIKKKLFLNYITLRTKNHLTIINLLNETMKFETRVEQEYMK